MIKNLYINGCSFTAGHEVNDYQTISACIQESTDLNVITEAKNGQCLESIFINTINHLAKLNPVDTAVVVGLTWPNRSLVTFGKYNMNSTTTDIGKKTWEDKFSRWRRISSPIMFTDDQLLGLNSSTIQEEIINKFDRKHGTHAEIFDNINAVKRKQIESDPEYAFGLDVRYFSQLIALQSFLKDKKFKHIFTIFDANIFKPLNHYLAHLRPFIDFDVIELLGFTKNPTSHPTFQDNKDIAKILIDKLELNSNKII
jgi:hypothetical protein